MMQTPAARIQNPNAEGLSASQKTAAKVKNGLNDVKGKMQQMKEKKERAEKEMLRELEEY